MNIGVDKMEDGIVGLVSAFNDLLKEKVEKSENWFEIQGRYDINSWEINQRQSRRYRWVKSEVERKMTTESFEPEMCEACKNDDCDNCCMATSDDD